MGEIAVSKLRVSDKLALRGLEIHDQAGVAKPQGTRPDEEAS
jgi:hypothetical protein